jgi:hypothetical protein
MLKLKACLELVFERCLRDARREAAPGCCCRLDIWAADSLNLPRRQEVLYKLHNVILKRALVWCCSHTGFEALLCCTVD